MSTFDFHGETFTYVDKFPAYAHAEFCEAMDDGEQVNSPRSTAVVLRLALASIAEADRDRFRSVCRRVGPDATEIMGIFGGLLAVLAERPTMLPAGSSDGPEVTPENSEPGPVASVTSLPERPVRADLQLALARSGS